MLDLAATRRQPTLHCPASTVAPCISHLHGAASAATYTELYPSASHRRQLSRWRAPWTTTACRIRAQGPPLVRLQASLLPAGSLTRVHMRCSCGWRLCRYFQPTVRDKNSNVIWRIDERVSRPSNEPGSVKGPHPWASHAGSHHVLPLASFIEVADCDSRFRNRPPTP